MATRLTIRFKEYGGHYHKWLMHECLRMGIKGTLRDRYNVNGTVEAIIVGSFQHVDDVVAIARKGPSNCIVDSVGIAPCPDPLVTGMVLLPDG